LNKEQIITTLKNHQANFKQLGVVRLALFGSVARNEATENSDIDLLVTFSQQPVTSVDYFNLQFYLEDLLGCSIDLITDKALRKELRPYIEKELIDVA
jgi:predicted nucleotidyltransferase